MPVRYEKGGDGIVTLTLDAPGAHGRFVRNGTRLSRRLTGRLGGKSCKP